MCGLFGIFSYGENLLAKDTHSIIKCLGIASMERGVHATGIAYLYKNRLEIFKEPKPANKFKFKIPVGVKSVIGHTRYATQGHQGKNQNNHPFSGNAQCQKFVLAHNGILLNDRELKKALYLPKSSIETDSYVAVQLLNKGKAINMDSVKAMAENVDGSFVFTILDDYNCLYIVKSNNPISMIHFKELKTYFYASTDEILWKGLINSSLFKTIKSQLLKDSHSLEEVNLKDGEILKIDPKGNMEYGKFKTNESYYFSFRENPYFNNGYDKSCNFHTSADEEYWGHLKTVARLLGHDPSITEALLSEGFHFDEIEEFIYGEYPQEDMIDELI